MCVTPFSFSRQKPSKIVGKKNLIFVKRGKREKKKLFFDSKLHSTHAATKIGWEGNEIKTFFFFGLGNDPNNFLKRKKRKIRGGSAIFFFVLKGTGGLIVCF